MGSRVVLKQILHWTVRNITLSGRCHNLAPGSRTLCSSSRWRCSYSGHRQDQAPLPRTAVPEVSLRSLTELGFTELQSEEIHQAVSSLKKRSAARDILSSLSLLLVLGFNCSSVLKLLEKCPELCVVKEAQLQQRVSYLRKLGVGEGSLQRMISHYPDILTVPVKTVKSTANFLREKCLFTGPQVTNILRQNPAVTQEDQGQLEYKFQYVYFRMGVKQADMVKARLFRFTLDEVRCRHAFLERRGLYQTPDKKGQTTIVNPKLDLVLQSDLDSFLTQLAQASAEEYRVFQKLLAREWKEEELELGHIRAEREDDDFDDEEEEDEDEEDDEEDELARKSGYVKKRKR